MGSKFLISKGADSIIKGLLRKEKNDILDRTDTFVEEFADEGLRTLYVARKDITELEFEEWIKEKKKAQLSLKNREEEVAKVDDKIEKQL